MRRIALLALLALTAACAREATSEPPWGTSEPISSTTEASFVPFDVVEGVRAEHPHTTIEDINGTYQRIVLNVPEPDNDDAVRWMHEAIVWGDTVEAWNDCLETSPTGEGCIEADADFIYSNDNPLGW
jgi:hypothetical protein